MAGKEESLLDAGENIKKPPETLKKNRETIDRDIVYHYSREHRLSRASAAVQELNSGNTPRLKLTSRLFGNRNNFLLFIAIIIVCGAFGMSFGYSGGGRNTNLGRNTLAVEILNEEGVLILDIEKTLPKRGEAYTGAMDIAVSPVMQKSKETKEQELPQMFTHRIFFTPKYSETYRISLPFEGTDFLVLLRINEEQKTLKLKTGKGN